MLHSFAFYYVRVDSESRPLAGPLMTRNGYGIGMSPEVPMTVPDRAYTSPIWYSPAKFVTF